MDLQALLSPGDGDRAGMAGAPSKGTPTTLLLYV